MLAPLLLIMRVHAEMLVAVFRRDRDRGALSLELLVLAVGLVGGGLLLAGIIYKIIEDQGGKIGEKIGK